MKKIIVSVFVLTVLLILFSFIPDTVYAHTADRLRLLAGKRLFIQCDTGELSTKKIGKSWHILKCHPVSPSPTPSPVLTLPSPSAQPSPSDTVHQPESQNPSMTLWHPVGSHDGLNVHEHGDRPPQWADDFSQKNFGHTVVWGGDESTPDENMMKHQAYKGFSMNASGVDLYLRHHSQSNPHGRSAPFHSYEVYAKDSSNNVSFWQGWGFYGYPEIRSQRMTRRNEQPGYDAVNKITWPGRDQFIISAPDETDWNNYLRCEQWYGHAGVWSWDLSITICGSSTYYSVDEHLGTIMDKTSWKRTGATGSTRRLEVTHYGPQNPKVNGEILPTDTWYCVKKQPDENRSTGATPTWILGKSVSGPNACPAGYLPQYLTGTFPKKGVYFETGNTAEKTFDTTGVSLPN